MLIKVVESDVVAIMCDVWSNIRHEPIINFLLSVSQSVFRKSFVLRCKAIMQNI